LEAIPSYQFYSAGYAGFANGGAGFTFSPQVTISVTELGYGSDTWGQEPATVLLLDTNDVILASAQVTFSSPILSWAHYETISPVTLTPGQTYYLWSFWTNGVWTGPGLLSSGPFQNGTFTVARDILYIGTADSTNADGSLPHTQGPPTVLRIGPNFAYVNTTAVILNGLQFVSGQVQIGFSISGVPAPSFTLLESDQLSGPWTTNLAAVLTTNTPGVSYTFTAPPDGPTRFYRVQIP
jgi:hypothetical protein